MIPLDQEQVSEQFVIGPHASLIAIGALMLELTKVLLLWDLGHTRIVFGDAVADTHKVRFAMRSCGCEQGA